MRRAATFLLALAAVPAAGGQRSHSFQVGAVVMRSARLRVEARRVQVSARDPVAVMVGAAPLQVAASDVRLPPGTLRVTVLY